MTTDLSGEQRIAVGRISGLVVVNAMIFHEILAQVEERVVPLDPLLQSSNPKSELCKHWKSIVDDINYYPIFNIARQILMRMSASKRNVDALRDLAQTAQRVVCMRAALRHDLMGRVYHRLLVERKFLGTYYTSIPAATMLLKLTLQPSKWQTNWSEIDSIAGIRIADLASGTGTLLMAAADAITDNYLSSSSSTGKKIDNSRLQCTLAENVLLGYDVLASATHLTASTLALRAPDVTFSKMNLYNLALGGKNARLGSLEFLYGRDVGMLTDLFGSETKSTKVSGRSEKTSSLAHLPLLDACVMNPPFTRSVGGNLLFGSLPDDERRMAQARLKEVVKQKNAPASITAGLGSVFVATADPHIKTGGRLALVLPKALLSGVAWSKTRELIRRKYVLEYMIASHDPERWNFSESTSLSEVLLVARKLGDGAEDVSHLVIAVNLWKNPTTAFEAQAIIHSLERNEPPEVTQSQGTLDIVVGNSKYGEAIACRWDDPILDTEWIVPCAFAQTDLIRSTHNLLNGFMILPGESTRHDLSLCPLGKIATLGPDRRDIHDGFQLSNVRTPYPAIWGHDASAQITIAQQPNRFLNPLSKPKKKRPLRKLEHLWPRAGRLVLAERLWLNTQKVVMARCPRKVLSNVWWPVSLKSSGRRTLKEKALALWMNSTFGLLTLLANREETRGAWVAFKKPVLAKLPVLDVCALSGNQLEELASLYDRVGSQPLLSMPEMIRDEVRSSIDKGIADSLDLPDFSVLRELLSQEPIICLKPLK